MGILFSKIHVLLFKIVTFVLYWIIKCMENNKNSFPHFQSVDSVLTKLVYAIPLCSVGVMCTEDPRN